ncbi:MAG: LysE family translocator [Alphaproteobacteria bacterium]|nr:LysE family translocator [Alphaproteobacteria bacterium]
MLPDMPLDPSLAAGFLAAAIVMTLIPGPDTLFVLGKAMTHRARGGVAAALGIGSGAMVHALAAALGLSALIAASEPAFAAVRWLGALYLIWIGIQSLRASLAGQHDADARGSASLSIGVVFRQAALTNISNVKVIVFFLAMLPQFVDPARGHVGLQLFLLGCIFNTLEVVYLIAVGLLAGRASSWLLGRRAFRRVLDAVAGTLFVGLGLRLMLSARGSH